MAARIEGAIASGIHDKGLEMLTADSMSVTKRQVVYTHPAGGAQSHLLTIAQRTRNKPMLLQDARAMAGHDQRARLMVNARSGRAAVMIPTRAIMLDDGAIQPRVALIRPMDELRYEVRELENTRWEEAGEAAFASAWDAEVAKVAEFSIFELHVITGLLLPIWRLLPQDYCRVYRLQTDDGERIVGCTIAPAHLPALYRNLGIDRAATIGADQAWQALCDGSSIVALAGNMTLRRVKVMNDDRIELSGFTDGMRDWLKAIGLFLEIIQWKTRFFVPMSVEGPAILSRLMERHRLIDIAGRT